MVSIFSVHVFDYARLQVDESLTIDGWGSLKLLDVKCDSLSDRLFFACGVTMLFTPD
jgi:hypothetical protein